MTISTANKPRAFLTARWSNLGILSYAVPPEVLEPLTPPGCELDTREGRAYVSLVAFDFRQTRVWGISWPMARNFPEVNLRFYVRNEGRRGVCFVREFVPCQAVALAARLLYNEPYKGVAMKNDIVESVDAITIRHELEIGRRSHTLEVVGRKPAVRPGAESEEHFFKEHNWGYGTSRAGRLIAYQVEHETWDVFPVASYKLHWDWQAVYGPQWAFLQDRPPDHLLLAAGSAVRVMPLERQW
jgi:uncharacterized protein